MSRKSARETAFKTIFEIPFHSTETPSDIISYTADSSEKDDLSGANDILYFKNITMTCFENIDNIDSKISSVLKNWTMERISKVNLSILRLAICEILYFDDIPTPVSINEAVELAKKFGDDESPSFVNGVLASLA